MKTPQLVSPDEEIEGASARAMVNYAAKCKLCGKRGTISFVDDKKNPSQKTYSADESGSWVTFACFECRGLEITGWTLDGCNFTASGVDTGSSFDISFPSEDGSLEFYDFDAGSENQVSVLEVELRSA